MVDVQEIMARYFKGEPLEILLLHGRMVAELAVSVGRTVHCSEEELVFLEEASMLHDVGVCQVYAPGLGLHGEAPYIMHGILGREILEREGLPLHALVCERHIGVGLTVDDILRQQLPLPHREMVPCSTVEEIICFADLFFSKRPHKLTQRSAPEHVRSKLAVFGEHKLQIFDSWLVRFGSAL